MEPAIKLAEEGFIVPGELAELWRRSSTQDGSSSMYEIISATPASKKSTSRPMVSSTTRERPSGTFIMPIPSGR